MKNRLLRFALPVLGLLTASLSAQQPATPAPDYHQMITVIRVTPGKSAEFVKFIGETSKKVAQLRANSGEIVSWSLLRAVYPSGKEAAGDYVITTLYKGVPPEPKSGSALDPVYKQAGVTMTSAEANVIRNSLSSAVTTEIWRVRQRVGAAAKGHYVLRNQMRVKDSSGYNSCGQRLKADRRGPGEKGRAQRMVDGQQAAADGNRHRLHRLHRGCFPLVDGRFCHPALSGGRRPNESRKKLSAGHG